MSHSPDAPKPFGPLAQSCRRLRESLRPGCLQLCRLIGLIFNPLFENCSQTEPPRSILVIAVGPTDNSSVLSMNDRCASQGNWNSKAHGSIIGHSLRCRKLPFGNGAIAALEARIYFHHGVREELSGFL